MNNNKGKKIRVEPKGLGDTLANLTYITGIDVTVKRIAGVMGIDDCGCTARQEKLNDIFPYKNNK